MAEMESLNSGNGRQLTDISASLQQWTSHTFRSTSSSPQVTRRQHGISRARHRPAARKSAVIERWPRERRERAFAASVEESDSRYSLMRLLLIGMLVVSATVAAFVVHGVRSVIRTLKNIASDLADGANQVASAAVEVAGAAQGLSQGSSKQAASLEETSAAMVEMTSISRKNSEALAHSCRHGDRGQRADPHSQRSLDGNGRLHERHQGIERQGREDHQDHR